MQDKESAPFAILKFHHSQTYFGGSLELRDILLLSVSFS